MGATLIALALFGCSDDATACERMHVPTQTYESQAACSARLDEALQSEPAMRAEYPTVYAQCLTTRELARLGSGTVDLSEVNGGGLASAGF